MIVRAKRETNYTIMSNVGLNDERLSFKAKGMLAYLLSKPDNWRVSDRHLATIGPDGRAAVQAALKELETFGYLKRERIRSEDGTFSWVSTIYDEPWPGFPATDKPATVYPATENRARINTDVVKTDVTNTEQSSSSSLPSSSSEPSDDDDKKVDGTVIKAWHENIGVLTPIISAQLHDLIDEVGVPSVIHGIVTAVSSNVRNFKYVQACAVNHASGKVVHRNGNKQNDEERARLLSAAKAARIRIRDAEKFGEPILPWWTADIEKAKEAGLI